MIQVFCGGVLAGVVLTVAVGWVLLSVGSGLAEAADDHQGPWLDSDRYVRGVHGERLRRPRR